MTNVTSPVPAVGTDSVLALAVAPHFDRDGICFVGRESGLYRSTDGGGTWHGVYESLQLTGPLMTTALAISPDWRSDHHILAGVDGGILRSTDGGNRWAIVQVSQPAPLVSSLVVSPLYAQDGVVVAGTLEDGIFRSSDRGASWVPWNFGLLDLSVLALAISPNFAQDEVLFAGTETGLFRSTNGGRAWREVPLPGEAAPVVSLALSPQFGDDGIAFAGTEAEGLFRSDDRGDTWCLVDLPVIEGAVSSIVVDTARGGKPALLVLIGNALLTSPDGGATWTDQQAHPDRDHEMTMLVAPLGLGAGRPLLIGGSDGNVVRIG